MCVCGETLGVLTWITLAHLLSPHTRARDVGQSKGSSTGVVCEIRDLLPSDIGDHSYECEGRRVIARMQRGNRVGSLHEEW